MPVVRNAKHEGRVGSSHTHVHRRGLLGGGPLDREVHKVEQTEALSSGKQLKNRIRNINPQSRRPSVGPHALKAKTKPQDHAKSVKGGREPPGC